MEKCISNPNPREVVRSDSEWKEHEKNRLESYKEMVSKLPDYIKDKLKLPLTLD